MSYQYSPLNPVPPSLFSWPPSPPLLIAHITSRLVMTLSNIVGIPLLFVSAIDGETASGIVAGSFLIVSVFLSPLFALWNKRHLKRARISNQRADDTNSYEGSPRKPRLGLLKFVLFIDALGTLALLCVFGPLMVDINHGRWGWGGGHYVMYSYGTVSVLIAMILHGFLFVSELAQFWTASRACKPKKMVCPHCNHTMTQIPQSSTIPSEPESEETIVGRPSENLIDSDTPRISMNPGQETGTTFKTPRQSEHSARAVHIVPPADEANEAGESENDSLIKKSG